MEIRDLEHFKSLVKDKIKDKWYFYKRTEVQKQAQTEELPFLIDFFKTKLNVTLYPIYGTLLGIIRDNDYILHDNDIDLSYLSKYSNKEDVIKEYHEICQILDDNKLLAKKCSCIGQLHSYSQTKTYAFDIWTSFIINNKYYLIPLVDGDIDEKLIKPFKSHLFRKINILIPNNPEEILNSIYIDWKTPAYSIGNYRGIRKKWKKIL